MLNEIVGFTVPIWMIEKMKCQMESQRTDKHLRSLSKEVSAKVCLAYLYYVAFIYICVVDSRPVKTFLLVRQEFLYLYF